MYVHIGSTLLKTVCSISSTLQKSEYAKEKQNERSNYSSRVNSYLPTEVCVLYYRHPSKYKAMTMVQLGKCCAETGLDESTLG